MQSRGELGIERKALLTEGRVHAKALKATEFILQKLNKDQGGQRRMIKMA